MKTLRRWVGEVLKNSKNDLEATCFPDTGDKGGCVKNQVFSTKAPLHVNLTLLNCKLYIIWTIFASKEVVGNYLETYGKQNFPQPRK